MSLYLPIQKEETDGVTVLIWVNLLFILWIKFEIMYFYNFFLS